MPIDLTDAAIARRLALERWGPTGFRCPTCGHDRGYQLGGNRVRQFQCRACRHQASVTAGTVMHATKLPLRVWAARGERHEAGVVQSASAFAADHEIARSSAWHLGQRLMGALDLVRPGTDSLGGYAVETFRCRRPRRTPELPELGVHPYLREHRSKLLVDRPPLLNRVVIGVWGHDLVLGDACASPAAVAKVEQHLLVLPMIVSNRGYDRWLRGCLERVYRTVCVRWIGRYLRTLLGVWSRQRTEEPAVPWVHAVLSPHRKLDELRATAAAG